MENRVLLITPPFVQMNTPYPAASYLKGFLNTRGITSFQIDLGLEVLLRLFTKDGLADIFIIAKENPLVFEDENLHRIVSMEQQYLITIEPVIQFLQNKNNTLAHLICTGHYLPEAARFAQLTDLEWAFGSMGIIDKARHLATLYLEDIGDLINQTVDEYFGFSRYAERISRSANSFDALHGALQGEVPFVVNQSFKILEPIVNDFQPSLIAITVPFPGNLFAALACGRWLKANYSGLKVVLGGGYPNTELRSLQDERIFENVDFITLDDGEQPMVHLLEYLEGKRSADFLKRTFLLNENELMYANGSFAPDFKQIEVGTPDYSDLKLREYLSVIELVNPMHRLWSDGRWNKMTLAHGCYWGKCTFCDISLDYIQQYEATTASVLVDRMEQIIRQTGENGFHFVDEAAPPALMRDVAIEILKRGLTVVWWTNIRFEKNFTEDLCRLLALSGCIAVSGGLEVASDRLLKLIDKGITVAQVAKVTSNFTQAGILVHAYLMYGFPTQTAQETIDSLEMVRQLLAAGVVHSGFWHQFAMTAHSPVGMNPEKFGALNLCKTPGKFANNDLEHADPSGADHAQFAEGLRKSLFNYMHGIGFEFSLNKWFDFNIPKTCISPQYINEAIKNSPAYLWKPNSKIVWTGLLPNENSIAENKHGFSILVQNRTQSKWIDHYTEEELDCCMNILYDTHISQDTLQTFAALQKKYQEYLSYDFEMFWQRKVYKPLHDFGFLVL